ncbi:putative nuclease HARBI1 [Wyeomyia smithii]|uniref:putative nuclease HARBI1 n=1 Tax=Wyeomyia smithii TaxID=174621 RepID=UPI0024681207|nr:putative nuclease HARBI1 [Wyeomyia smithii]
MKRKVPKISAAADSFVQDLMEPNSDPDSDPEFESALIAVFGKPPRRKRKRVANFVVDVVDKYTDAEFQQHFRVKRTTAEKIIRLYSNPQFYRENLGVGRRNTPAKDQMLAFLWFLANKSSYRQVGTLFNMAETTFFRHLNQILNFFYDISKDIIRVPQTTAEKESVAESFNSISGFPDVIGCIDVLYISIRKPANKKRNTDQHDEKFMTLQGICDANCKFLDVCIGSPSRIHHSRVFSLSPISEEIAAICQDKFHILGDAAYPIREYLLTPYSGNLSAKKQNYNLRHTQTRVQIENAFGILKHRFRQLMRLDFFEGERMCKFVMACCVLHNMCIDENDYYEGDEDPEDPDDIQPDLSQSLNDQTSGTAGNAALRKRGELKRKQIATMIM